MFFMIVMWHCFWCDSWWIWFSKWQVIYPINTSNTRFCNTHYLTVSHCVVVRPIIFSWP